MVKVPLSKLLPQVQLEAVLWGFGTALGELPPYFISRAGTNLFSGYYALCLNSICRNLWTYNCLNIASLVIIWLNM
jgi:hypothetical protein